MSEGGRLWKVKRGDNGVLASGLCWLQLDLLWVLATFGVFRILPTRTVVELF